MMRNILKKKVISGIVLGSVVTSLGITAFASDFQEPTNQEISTQRGLGIKHKGMCKNGERNQERMKECLSSSGIFSESEIEKITTYLENKRTEMQAERESLKDKTDEERKAYFEAKKENREDMMNGLVNEGIITQDQLDKLKETMPQKPMGQNKGRRGIQQNKQ